MKTKLPKVINTISQAKRFLTELYKNEESYHPEDDANDIVGDLFTKEEADQLNKLMNDIYNLPGNNSAQDMAFDPCQWLLDIDLHHYPDMDDIDKQQAEILLKAYSREKIINWILNEDKNASVSDDAQIFDYGKPATKAQLKKVFWALYNDIHSEIENVWK